MTEQQEKFYWAKYYEAIETDQGFAYMESRFGGKKRGQYYQLDPKQIGADSWTFSLKTDSFGLISHYGNDWHGRLINFLQEFDGMSFEQAVQEICQHYGISLDDNAENYKPKSKAITPIKPIPDKPKEIISIEFGEFTDDELMYWEDRKISRQTLAQNNVHPIRSFEQYNPNTDKTWKKSDLTMCFAYNIEKQGDKIIGCHVKTPKMSLVDGSKDLLLGQKPTKLLGLDKLDTKLGFMIVCYGIADYLSAVEHSPQHFNFVDAKAEALKLPKAIVQTAQSKKLRVFAMPDTDFQGRRLAKKLPENHKNIRILTAPKLEHQYFREDKKRGWIDLDMKQVEQPEKNHVKPELNDLNDYICKFGFDSELRNLIKKACFPEPKVKIANSIYLHEIHEENTDIPFVIFKLGNFDDGDFFDNHNTISANNFNDFFDNDGRFVADVREIFENFEPRNIFFIYDWNTFRVKWNPDKDLAIKPLVIRKQITRLHKASASYLNAKEEKLRKFFFASVQDDLSVQNWDELFKKRGSETVLEKLRNEKNRNNEIWNKIDLTELTVEKVNTHFALDSAERFYSQYQLKDQVKENEFVFKYGVWQYKWGVVEYLRPMEAGKYFYNVGRLVMRKNYVLSNNTQVVDYVSVLEGSLKLKEGKEFTQHLEHFDGFTNQPDFTNNYERVVEKFDGKYKYRLWNVAEPISIKPKAGDFPTIKNYLHHVFRGDADFENHIIGDRLTFFLDWLKVAVNHPTQKLPMILLVSKEQRTGKSTLMDLLQVLFGANAIKTNMEDLLGKFNSHNAYKKFVFLEEVKMEGEKAAPKDTLKEMITGPTTFVEGKGLQKEQIENHKVLIAASNHETNIMKLEKEDSRWFVNKVHSVKKVDFDLMPKMVKELPQFLHYLLTDPIHHEAESRLWFKEELIRTEEFWKIVEDTKSLLDKSIEELVRDTMLTYKLSSLRVCNEWLIPELKMQSGYTISGNQVSKFFREKEIKKQNASNIEIPIGWTEDGDFEYFRDKKTQKIPKKRYWELFAKDWLTEEEVAEMQKSEPEEKQRDFEGDEVPF